jgi:hypothetical protein
VPVTTFAKHSRLPDDTGRYVWCRDWGTVTNVNFPIVSGLQFLLVAGDYVASGGNGAQCYVSYTYMPPAS